MKQGQGSKRTRGRNGGRRGSSNRQQLFDSNGPSVRIRGNAFQVHEKYLTLARDAASAGDRVAAENYYQHAEHYFRIYSLDQEERAQRQPGPGQGPGQNPGQSPGQGQGPDAHRRHPGNGAGQPQQHGQNYGNGDARSEHNGAHGGFASDSVPAFLGAETDIEYSDGDDEAVAEPAPMAAEVNDPAPMQPRRSPRRRKPVSNDRD